MSGGGYVSSNPAPFQQHQQLQQQQPQQQVSMGVGGYGNNPGGGFAASGRLNKCK